MKKRFILPVLVIAALITSCNKRKNSISIVDTVDSFVDVVSNDDISNDNPVEEQSEVSLNVSTKLDDDDF